MTKKQQQTALERFQKRLDDLDTNATFGLSVKATDDPENPWESVTVTVAKAVWGTGGAFREHGWDVGKTEWTDDDDQVVVCDDGHTTPWRITQRTAQVALARILLDAGPVMDPAPPEGMDRMTFDPPVAVAFSRSGVGQRAPYTARRVA